MQVAVQAEPFDTARELARLKARTGTRAGAIVTFTGLMREMGAGGALASMTLEHYPAMTLRELERIAEEAQSRWQLDDLTLLHRHGTLEPGDEIVLVITAAAHRQAAFEAAAFLMDYLKTRAPFWKKETPADAKASGGTKKGKWVEARASDDEAAARWRKK